MNEARTYASLSSGLLARKGTAKPAMRPQGYTGFDDLGWNDMGHGREERSEPGPEHVPSSIAALTPAPRKPVLSVDEHELDEVEESILGEEEGQDEGGFDEPEQIVAGPFAGPEALEAPEDFAAPMDLPAADEEEAVGEPHVVAQQRAILESFDGEEEHELQPVAPIGPAGAAKAEIVPLPKRVAAAAGRKAAFTLRLDGDRHLRLRLACAVTGHSAQQIVTGALDSALAAIPEIEALASRVPAKAGGARTKRN